MKKIYKGYVKTNDGLDGLFVQIPDPSSQWGFYLASDDQTWDGGFGIAESWEPVKTEEVPEQIREKLDFLLEDQEVLSNSRKAGDARRADVA